MENLASTTLVHGLLSEITVIKDNMPQPRFQRRQAEHRFQYVNGRLQRRRARRRGSGRSRFSRIFGHLLTDAPNAADADFSVQELNPDPPVPSTSQPISHRDRRQAAEQAWASCRGKAVESFIDAFYCLGSATCSVPSCEEQSVFRCTECGPHALYCSAHMTVFHQGKLHVPDMWKDDHFSPVFIEQEAWRSHVCNSGKARTIVVVDARGRQHSIPITFCQCQSDIYTLVKLQLWPATPIRPAVAFSFDLMHLLRMMFLECHVALLNLCNCLTWLSPQPLQNKVKNIYKLLAEDSFAEFRYFCRQLEALYLDEQGTPPTCPACPKSDGKKFISFDAIFGLKRWKKSGQSDNPPRFGTTYFLNQTEVDNFMEGYNTSNVQSSSYCSNFQASDHLRSKVRTTKVDETGVFGAVCRHEMPVKFFSLKQGERLGNAVYLLQHLIQGKQRGIQLYILYDIACKLKAHLQRSNHDGISQMLQQIELAIPTFHVYGHKPDCQTKLSPRRLKGFCLSDGEQVERLWSFLRKFSSITKEMTPSNRIDALTDALLHYARKMCRNLPKLLVHRYQKADDLNTSTLKELEKITVPNEQGGSVTVDDIRRWMEEEAIRRPLCEVTGVDLPPTEVYALKLHSFYELRREYEKECISGSAPVGSVTLLLSKLKRLDAELVILEQGNPRWEESSSHYLSALAMNADRHRKRHLFKLHTLCVDRWLLITLKQKYADGQAIAKLLINQIKSATTKLKKGVDEYNGEMSKLCSSHQPLLFANACNVSDDVWNCLEGNSSARPANVRHLKRQWIDIVHKVDRSNEEMSQLKIEMNNMFNFISSQEQHVAGLLQTVDMSMGRKSLLKAKHAELVMQIHHCFNMFHPRFIDLSAYKFPSASHCQSDSLDSNTDPDEVCQILMDLLGEVSSDEEED